MWNPVHDLHDEGNQIHLAFSPCPNDTFMMDALVHHRFDHGLNINTHLMDIQALNEAALQHKYSVTKISVATLPLISNEYELLESGAAMGFGCGPILVTKSNSGLQGIEDLRVAIPGRNTTAHYLFNHFFPEVKQKKFMLFSEIESAILDGTVDAGVLIHEGRFTYALKGLALRNDLGAMWEECYQLPIPLGVLVAKKSMGKKNIDIINQAIRESIQFAFQHPEASEQYVLEHSQEMSPSVVKQHIDLYVNAYSITMGEGGHQAINFLLANIPKSN